MQIELAQIALADGDTDQNVRRVLDVIDKADVAGGTRLVVFPETTLSGFPTSRNVASVAQNVDGPVFRAVTEAARSRKVSVVLGLTESEDGQFYNSNVLIDERGQLLLRYRKTHLWSCDIGVFSTGNSFDTCLWNGLRVGMLICYDVEFPEPARALGMLGSQLAIVTDGNMDPYGPVHRRAGVARAMENQMFVAIVNRCGRGDNNLTFPGESVLIDPFGDVVASAGAEEVVLKVDVDLTKLESSRRNYNYLDEKRVQLQLKTVERTDGSRSLLIDS